MEFLKNTADLLTFQEVADEFGKKIHGGISIEDMRLGVGLKTDDSIIGGANPDENLALGSLRDSYIPIGLYLDERLPKNEVQITYGGGCDYSVIDDTIYDRLVDNISLKRKYTATPKTLKLKSLFMKKTLNKSVKNIKNTL